VPPGKFEVEGRPIACGSRAAVLDKNLNDVTTAYPQFVIINPERFGKLSPTLKLWAFSVACGFALHGPDQACRSRTGSRDDTGECTSDP
jgi:hypothetical protein